MNQVCEVRLLTVDGKIQSLLFQSMVINGDELQIYKDYPKSWY